MSVRCCEKNGFVDKMLNEDSLGKVGCLAADCNHDGLTDISDIKLLRDAGMVLASVDQTKPAQVLFESSLAYVEYIDIIEQSPEQDTQTQDAEYVQSEPEDEEMPVSIFDFIVSLIMNLLRIFSKIW